MAKFYPSRRFMVRLRLGLLALAFAVRAQADWLHEVGADRLSLTFAGVPNSAGVVSQVEAGNSAGDNYLPDGTNTAFVGKTLVNKSPGTGTSGHATTVAQIFYGNATSLLPGTTVINCYSAGYWAGANFLNYGSTAAPLTEVARVQNHSWIGVQGAEITSALVEEVDQRLDFAINRDGFVAVVATNNGASPTLPPLLAQAYNQITVGLSTGAHSAGFTAYDGTGRIKPDIVAPDSLTSFATPKVSATAGVLAARLGQSPFSLTGADVPRVVKALLLAGATKEEFPAWANTADRPLDLIYGAGELNALLSYRILASGRATPSNTVLVPETGWAATSINGGAQQTYFFEIPAGADAAPFSVALTWHRQVTDGNSNHFIWSPLAQPLVNLDLALYAASGFTVGTQISASVSTVDNVEHIYSAALAPGRYAFRVSSPSGAVSTAYALAWRTTPSVTVTATAPDAREIDGTNGVFTVARSGATTTPLWVPLSVGGTAQAGIDYVSSLPSGVLIPAGSASVTLAVAPVADSTARGDRTVTLAATGDYSLAATTPAAIVTIHDKPCDEWRFAHFSAQQLADAAVSGDQADPDGDGLSNLLEYALGADPLAADAMSVLPVVGTENDETGNWLTLAYTQPAGRADLVYAVGWSTDLSNWQSGAAVVTEVSRSAVTGGERVVVKANASLLTAPGQFLRLQVTR